MRTLSLEIITPDEQVFSGQAEAVTLPATDGEVTILPGHIPLIATLVPGTAVVQHDGQRLVLAMTRGVLETDGRNVRVLAQSADRADGLQEEVIERAKQAAEKLLAERRDDREGFAEASALLEREIARLKTVRRHRAGRRTLGSTSVL